MTDFTSEVKTIPYNDDQIFAVLSDMSNLERIKERIPQEMVKDFSFDTDTCSFTIDPVGSIMFRIVEREPNKTVKFSTTNSPIPLQLLIQLKQVAEKDTKMKMTVRAELNPFIKSMISKPLQQAIDKISEAIANMPFENNG
jgi:carbon monoxide dehydrogenase subunit G